jgi:hypothetical protein
MKERHVNVYENKGSLWKAGRKSGNVIENTGTYGYMPGMLLKRKEVSKRYGVDGRWVLPTYHLTESADLRGLWVGPFLTTMEAGTLWSAARHGGLPPFPLGGTSLLAVHRSAVLGSMKREQARGRKAAARRGGPHSRTIHGPWPEVPATITQYEFQNFRVATRKSKLAAQRAARTK